MNFVDTYRVEYDKRDFCQGVDELFYKRWSPRSFKKTAISKETLEIIFDTVRWSPSCYNDQPWVFLTSDDSSFETFLSLLVEKNQEWAKNASLIGFIIAKRDFDFNGLKNDWAVFDCGAAWMSLCLAARLQGLYAHGMAGIKKDEVHRVLGIMPDEYEVVAGFALGSIDVPEELSQESQKMEFPSSRKPLDEIWKQGKI